MPMRDIFAKLRAWWRSRWPSWQETIDAGRSPRMLRGAVLRYRPRTGENRYCWEFQDLMLAGCKAHKWYAVGETIYYRHHGKWVGHGIVIGHVADKWWAAGPEFFLDRGDTAKDAVLTAVLRKLEVADRRAYFSETDYNKRMVEEQHAEDVAFLKRAGRKYRGAI